MEIIPAIDIKGGKCVRLYQGDYSRETIYSESPVEVATHWVAMGATRIHVVDLDGAKAGSPVNNGLVGEIASSVPAQVQLGGGIRTVEAARRALSFGASRIVIGTAAVEGSSLVEKLCHELGAQAVVVSVDSRDGYALSRGWTERSEIPISDLVKRIDVIGVERFVYTDVTRDGTLTEPNFRAIEELMAGTALKMMVAGGISSLGHLRRLSEQGVEAAIVGKAAYSGDIDLREAIEALGANNKSTP